MLIKIIEKRLTDGSFVTDVKLVSDVLECVSERDAAAMVDAIREAIEAHTNNSVTVQYVEA